MIVNFNNFLFSRQLQNNNKMSRTTKQQTKARFDRENNPAPSLWSDDRIPPLVSANPFKSKEDTNRIQIQSLNQSEVRSIYTIERQLTDNHTLEIFNNDSQSHQGDLTDRFETKAMTTQRNNSKQQKSSANKIYESPQPVYPTNNILTNLEDDMEFDIQNCYAVKLFQQIVQQKMQSNLQKQQKYQYPWMKSKSPSELIFTLVNNQDRLRLYVHFLTNQIYLNERAKVVNELHQTNLHQYSATLKEVYTAIICLLSKLAVREKKTIESSQKKTSASRVNSSQKELTPEVSIFENGLSIDIDPKMNALKRKNNDKIRQLREAINQQERNLQVTKKLYEQIIQNYAVTIENINKTAQSAQLQNRQHLKQSRVQVEVDEEEEHEVRKKNHTFGMKGSISRNEQRII